MKIDRYKSPAIESEDFGRGLALVVVANRGVLVIAKMDKFPHILRFVRQLFHRRLPLFWLRDH